MEKTIVVNIKHEKYDVYIGRTSLFGNPYRIGKHGSRKEVIELYRKEFYRKIRDVPVFKNAVEALRGHILGCHCKPLACHGDVIVEYLEKNHASVDA